jgi:hypothetical protein
MTNYLSVFLASFFLHFNFFRAPGSGSAFGMRIQATNLLRIRIRNIGQILGLTFFNNYFQSLFHSFFFNFLIYFVALIVHTITVPNAFLQIFSNIFFADFLHAL